MLNAILDAISVSLGHEFGDGYQIYMEQIEQGWKEPCFFISCLKSSSKHSFEERYFRGNQFCVQYFPSSNERQQECNAVYERMLGCLEYITVNGDGKPIKGTRMECEMVDGSLSFLVNYDFFVYQTREESMSMSDFQTGMEVKGEE